MIAKRAHWALLPLFILGCSDDSTTVQPPAPLTPDEQTVANVRTIRDAYENYAAAHGGSYGGIYSGHLNLPEMDNPYTGVREPERFRAAYPGQIGVEWYLDCPGNVLGYRVTGYGKDHMVIALESMANVPADVQYAHDVTAANAQLVLDAALHWGETYNGKYPTDVNGDENNAGKTLIGMLPGGQLLINANSGVKTNPEDGVGLAVPGAVGFMGSDSGGGTIDSFQIEAYACDGDVMLQISSYSEGEYRVVGQSNLLRNSVEAFKQASGHFPHDLNTETTPDGKTVSDLYFASATHEFTKFVNPYTGNQAFAFVGTAANKGEIAYQPIETAGVVTDYVITARGLHNEIVHAGPKP